MSDLIEKTTQKIAFCGIKGAFAYIAARKLFPEGELVSYPSFAKAYESVEKNECDYAVLPLENSFAGDVNQVFDLMFRGRLHIIRMFKQRIDQTLLGVKGAQLSDIKTVVSHQQAIDQCMGFIQEHGLKAEYASNTAVAAEMVSKKGDKSLASIGSEEAAALYGLDVIQKNINENDQNTTRFAVFSNHRPAFVNKAKDCTFIVLFTIKDAPGALAKAIKVFGDSGYNLKSLKSHPVKDVPWQYYFYTEVQGSLMTDQGIALLEKLAQECIDVISPGFYVEE
ncbi:prephenate dehydratase [Treponema sp.]|uniref:prephenate dehydratase n=1 Tax=Treponema sp. TaxID=166 RepID=UPI00298EAAD1|nr:prephenate dehydratase domain-containing protein [Treponema sp.]MCR5614056.1 ACT domain-containing protein [Treponema sp.]